MYQSTPGYGSNQWQAPPPPAPALQAQPQPDWRGVDYFNAHSNVMDPDASMYQNAWDRVQNYDLDVDPRGGVGIHEAKHWHRRAYGGLGDLAQMDNVAIGAAAAYEAYRTWIHNSSLLAAPLADVERQREGLTGLAVAEASRLLQFAGRPDNYSRMEVSEAAAATASIIFYHSRARQDRDYGRGRSHSRGWDDGEYGLSARRGSFSDVYDDPYALDARASGGFRPRSHSRHRALSSSRHSPMMYPGSVVGGSSVVPATMQMPYPSNDPNGYGGGYGAPAYGAPASFTAPMPIQGQGSIYSSASMPIQAQPSVGSGMMPPAQTYNPAPIVPIRARSNSISVPYAHPQYPQAHYVQGQGQYMAPRATAAPQPQTIILTGSGHRRHHKKHRHHKRSKSLSRY